MAVAMAQSPISTFFAGSCSSSAASFSRVSRRFASVDLVIIRTDHHHHYHHRRCLGRSHQQYGNKRIVCSSNDSDYVETEEISKGSKSVSDFIRFCDNGEEGFHLQTATITYRKPFPFSLIQPNIQAWMLT